MAREDRIEKYLWIALLLLVPVSSSPLLPLGEGTLIRPLSFVPALLLVAIAGIRFLFLNQRPNFSRDNGCFATLLCFAAYVLASGLASVAFLPDDLFKGQAPLDSFLRGFLTLVIGIIFYSLARLHIRSRADLLLAEKCLFLGIGASIALAVYQVAAIYAGGDALREAQAITDLFAVRTTGLTIRAQGMGLEASALGYQIAVLLIPFLVARSVSRQASVGLPKQKMIWVVLPGTLLALVGLLSAGSRFGIASAIAIVGLSALRALWRGRVFAVFALAAMVAAGGVGAAYLSNLRVGAGATYVTNVVPGLIELSVSDLDDRDQTAVLSDAVSVSGRVAAWQSATGVWLDNPLFGISLGNTYRYFGKYAPDWALDSLLFNQRASEGAAWLDPNAPEKANAKNLAVRLLAETGLVGTALFLLFFLRHVTWGSPDAYAGAFRVAAVAAVCLNWLNSDTFADPAMWIVLALCHATGRIGEPGRYAVGSPAASQAAAAA